MPGRYFSNRLSDWSGGTVVVDEQLTAQSFGDVLRDVLGRGPAGLKPSVYTGAAGIAYALWHAHRQTSRLTAVAFSEEELLDRAEQYARVALGGTARQAPGEHYGWSLLAGQAGVYATAALVFDAGADLAERQGRQARAAGLRQERQQWVQQYCALHRLACSSACQEDEVLYGRSGYLLGCLLLNNQLQPGSVPQEAMQSVVEAIIASGRSLAVHLRSPATFPTPLFYLWPPGPDASPYLGAAQGLMGRQSAADTPGCTSPLFFFWHAKPYLGAAHGMLGILYALLHVPDLLAAVPGAQRDLQAALEYVLTLECDAEGRPGKHFWGQGQGGHYPSQMGPWRDREPLVHWCHGATGAVFLFCKAHQQLGSGDPRYLAAAQRSGEAVWERGLLKKGPGCCHGVSGGAYALLRLYRTTGQDRWLHRALEFAKFMNSAEFKAGARTPDHPHSLYEGWAAALCLWADLGEPKAGGFPLFEVELEE